MLTLYLGRIVEDSQLIGNAINTHIVTVQEQLIVAEEMEVVAPTADQCLSCYSLLFRSTDWNGILKIINSLKVRK